LFFQFHGRDGLAYVRDHARAPAKYSKSGVFDNSGARYLSYSRGSCISCSDGGIHCGVLGVLWARIWCVLVLIPLLAATVLWPGATSLDSFGGPTYCGLRNLV
jgi:hypothetical protein